MSAADQDQNIQLLQYTIMSSYINIAAIRLFIYDFAFTFDQEYCTIWIGRVTVAKAIYVALLYVSLLEIIAYLVYFVLQSCEVCTTAIVTKIRLYWTVQL